MESDYNKVSKFWDAEPKTVWSYNKQQKLLNIFLKKFPNPIDLKKGLLLTGEQKYKFLADDIDINWNRDEYIDFILTHIIKYSKFGKILLSQLIGTGIGSWVGYNINKHYVANHPDPPKVPSSEEYQKNLNSMTTDVEKDSYTDSVLNNYIQNQVDKPSIIRKISPFALGLGAKGLSSYGIYELLNTVDKKRAKRMSSAIQNG